MWKCHSEVRRTIHEDGEPGPWFSEAKVYYRAVTNGNTESHSVGEPGRDQFGVLAKLMVAGAQRFNLPNEALQAITVEMKRVQGVQ